MRNVYIENNSLKDSLDDYLKLVNVVETEEVPTIEAVGRVCAKAIFAKVCDPTYNASAMDGIAVCSIDTADATELNPLTLKEGQFEYVNTGNAVNQPFDSVIMIEDVINNEDGSISIIAPSKPWQHIRCIGETVVATEMIFPSKQRIRELDLGAILASGNATVFAYKKPNVAVIPTGNEMVEDAKDLKKGKLMESNSRVMSALINSYGGEAHRYNICIDDESLLEDTIKKAVKENDAVLVNAGSSAGTKDYTKRIIERLGKVYTHGLAIKPGKPTILGIIDGKPVIGVPGYPVSAYIVMEKVVKEVIAKMTSISSQTRDKVKAVMTKRVVSSLKNEEFIRVALGFVDNKLVATPMDRGAAAVMSMVKADGVVDVDWNSEGIEAGEEVEAELYRPLDEIKKKLVIIGSHDVVIDIIGDSLPVSSAHVGSMGGILAIKADSAHIAPIHLLDKDTGEYNIPFIKKYFEQDMALIKGLGRTQGIVVPKGNPKGIKSVAELKGGKFSFANRQNGAGTRLLFDYQLSKYGIDKDEVVGYEKEYTTHLSVASAVLNGVVDCGMAVLSAANIMGLDFIPVGEESYDFLVRADMLEDERIKKFIATIKSPEFRAKVEEIGGYTFNDIGKVTIVKC